MDEVLYKGKFITMHKTKEGYEYVKRANTKDIVSVMAITDENKLVLIEQFRVPVNSRVIESPAGLVDDGETLLEAAKRELFEETGYVSDEWFTIYRDAPNSAGLTTETTNKFLAKNCKKVGKGGGLEEENENIKTHLIECELKDLADFLFEKEKAGVLVDPKIATGLFWYLYGLRDLREGKL